jgi:cobalt/nickel transport system permease protein
MDAKIPSFLLGKNPPAAIGHVSGAPYRGYIEAGIESIGKMIARGFLEPGRIAGKGLFQQIDTRIKLLLLFLFVILITAKSSFLSQFAIASLIFFSVTLSRIDHVPFYGRIAGYTFIFGFLITFPAVLNVITPGEIVIPVINLPRSYRWWIYEIPAQIGITRQGLLGVAMINLRIANSLSLSLLIIHTTHFQDLVRALKVFRVPESLLLIISLTHKYIFILSKTMNDMYLARKSRLAGHEDTGQAREWIANRIMTLFKKSLLKYDEIYTAMESRGFSGTVVLAPFPSMNNLSKLAGVIFFLAGVTIILI